MRRARIVSAGSAGSLVGPGGGSGGSTAVGGFDPQRRTELLAEARRKRVAWVEEARGVDEGIHGARRRKESEAADNCRKAESELERLFPSAVRFHDYLTALAGDLEKSSAGDLSAILLPFMVQDVDIGDDRPIPSHRDGADAYDVFLDKLRHPRAAEVVKSLQQFVAAFKDRAKGPQRTPTRLDAGSTGAPVRSDWAAELVSRRGAEERTATGAGASGGTLGVTAATMSGMMHAFLGRVESQMRESVLWRRETEAQWEETRECLERIVMHKVFEAAYNLAADRRRDESISNRLLSLGFLTEEHLGVAPLVDAQQGEHSWSNAEEQLVKMSSMRCPGDMLRCIIRCTRIVASILTGSTTEGVLPGADEFLPALILLVKRVNPPNVHSNLEFIQSFRDPSKLLSEAGYVLTQIVSAVCFLEEVDASVLSIAHTDFERGLNKFQETAREGLQAHQLEVKKEEEHARYVHNTSTNRQPCVSNGTPSSASAATANAETAGAGETGVVERRPGPATLPEPQIPQRIGPREVRAKRLAGVRKTQLLLDSGGAAPQSATIVPAQAQHPPPVEANRTFLTPWSSSQRWSSQYQLQHSYGDPSRFSTNRDGSNAGGAGLLGKQLHFVGCTASELRVSQLPMLLAEHHQLARLCEELLAERGEQVGAGFRRRRT